MALYSVLPWSIYQNTRKSVTLGVCLGSSSSLVCRRIRQEVTRRQTHLIGIRSQTCIGARRSSATARAGHMED